MKLIDGNYSDITVKELRQLSEKVYSEYRNLGGTYDLEKFKKAGNAASYADLLEIVRKKLVKVIESIQTDLQPNLNAYPGREIVPEALAEAILPSGRQLAGIFHDWKTGKGKLSRRRQGIDACYLFVHRMTREKWTNSAESDVFADYEEREEIKIDFPVHADEDDSLKEILTQYTNTESLQFAAVYNGSGRLCSGHLLYHKDVRKWLIGGHPKNKEKVLNEIGPKIHETLMSLNESIHELQQGNIAWTVLDVEQGGIFYYRMYAGVFAIGICLVQAEMENGRERMLNLVGDLQEYYGIGTGEIKVK